MQKSRLVTLLLGLLALNVALCGPALARPTPPGNSEVNQYTETLPGASGNQTPNPPGAGGSKGSGSGSNGSGGSSGSVISPQTQRQLSRLGPDGRSAAALALANAPRPTPASALRAAGTSKGSPAGKSSPAGGVVGALTGSGGFGLGTVLPVILLTVAAAGAGYALSRRRARQAG